MRLHKTAILIAVLSACVLSSSTCVLGRTWYVKQDQTGDAPTIQAAIDSSMAGDTVLVAPGTYSQTAITFFEKDSLSIIGENGANETILHNIENLLILWANHVNHLLIKGFTFENSIDCGLGIDWSSDAVIEECVFKNNQRFGILISVSSLVIIRSNLVYSNSSGIACIDECNGIVISNNTISDNNIGSGPSVGSGVELDAVGSYELYNNIITNNEYGVVFSGGNIEFLCNDAFANSLNYFLFLLSDPTGTNGNISIDPEFCGVNPPESGNFYLQSDSPCAPGNHPEGYACGLIGKFPVGCGTTSTKEKSWGKIKSLFK